MRATDVTAVTAVAARTLATCGIDKTRPTMTTLDNRYSRYILTRLDQTLGEGALRRQRVAGVNQTRPGPRGRASRYSRAL